MSELMTRQGPRLSSARFLALGVALLALGTPQADAATFNYLPSPVDVTPPTGAGFATVDVSASVPAGATGVIVQWVNSAGADASYGIRPVGSTDPCTTDAAKDGQQGWLMTGLNASRQFQICRTSGGVTSYLVGYTIYGVTFLTNRVDKSTATAASWVDVSIAAETGAATAIGAIFAIHCNSGSGSNCVYGVRKKGSTDNRLWEPRADVVSLVIIGVDGTEAAQQNVSTAAMDLYLVGYVTSGAVFFTNALDKSTGTTGSYVNVDMTADLGAGVANGVFLEIVDTNDTDRLTAVRPGGATYDYYADTRHQWAVSGLDAGDVFQQKVEINQHDLYVVGYSLADGAGAFRVKSGSYLGTGGPLSITGVGFQPDVVIVDSGGGGGNEAVIKTSTMGGTGSKDMDAAVALEAGQIELLTADGFTLGGDVDVNGAGITYYWVAFKAAPGAMKVGSYTGTPASVSGVGFTPALVMVASEAARFMLHRSDLTPGNLALSFEANGFNDAILGMLPNGFGLGANVRVAEAATTFHYVAFNRVPGRIALGTYTGNGTDNRDILGSGFLPEYVLLARSSNTAVPPAQGNPPAHKTASSGVGVDGTALFNGSVFEANNIEALLPDGFRVGTHQRVNNAVAPNNYYWATFGPHLARVYYRSIGTAADLANQGLITVTANSTTVTKTGGTGWLAANRGRGDRLTVGPNHYMILRVDSDNQLTLASPAVADYISQASYTIARQFETLQGWEDCVSRSAANTCKRPADSQEYFATSSSSLVADDRREIGIAYDDASPAFLLTATVFIQGSTTDVNHTITLTADPGNRHNGVPGAGVVVDGNLSSHEISIQDANVTLEWLEIVGQRGTDFSPIEVRSADGDLATNVLLQNLLIHDFGDKIAGGTDTSGIDLSGTNTLVGKSVTIRNAMIWDGDTTGIEGDEPLDTFLIENVSIHGMVGNGIWADRSSFTARNTIVTGSGTADFSAGAGSLSGSHNTSTDASAGFGTNAQTGVAAADVFVAPGTDLHLKAGANVAVDTGLDLSATIVMDVDGQIRPAGAGWDRGADEFGATTAVKLMSFAATGGDSSVVLEWRTGSELSNLGFHVYRGGSPSGPWTRLTSTLIPGLGSSAVGKAYSFRDAGLSNGARHYYRLEDVDASSKVTSHGPVWAVPQAAAPAEEEDGRRGPRRGKRRGQAADECPASVRAAYASVAGTDASQSLPCTRHGEPEAVALAVVERDARSATLELRTGGFYAVHEPAGTVRAFVPGFDFPQDEDAAALPVRRALVEAVVGRKVQLAGVRGLDLARFPGLVPSRLGKPEMKLEWDGTARATRRAGGALRGAASELVRMLPSVFQGETKSAVVELSPLRHDARRRQLVLARTLRVRLAFSGREPGESGRLARGRRRAPPVETTGEVLARLFTTGRGLHAVAFEQLFAGQRRGLPTAQLALRRQGTPVALHVEPDGDSFGPGGRLYFFADTVAPSTAYSAEVAYELVHSGDGRLMPRRSAVPAGQPLASASTGNASFETNRFYQPGLLEAPDPWLWEALAQGVTRSIPLALGGVDAASPQGAQLELFLQGASESGLPTDHHLSVSLNGAFVGETRFAGRRPHRLSLGVPRALLREGPNELTLTNVPDTGVSSLVFLDRVELAFPQRSLARGGRFEGAFDQAGLASVLTDEPPVALLDVAAVGEGGDPVWLTGGALGPGVASFGAEAGGRYLLVSGSGLLAPRVALPQASSLRSAANRADYLLIAPREFLPAAKPLLDRRADQGLLTRAVAFEEIADEFGHGRPSAEAIRDFLAFAFHSWAQPSPRYVLLLGDASYDPRNFMGTSPASPLPALWTRTSYLWTASDPLLAAVNGEDALPDLAIGRLPAASLEEAQRLVDKLVAWEDSRQGLAGPAALIADNPDLGGDFEANVADIAASFLADRSTQILRIRELGAATRSHVQHSLDAGLAWLSYVGHGGAAVWASENVWNSWDSASLQAQSRQPLLLTMNCLNGYFVAPAYDSLAESLVKPEGRGAIAAFSPSGLSLDAPAHQYHRELTAEILSGRHQRLGDAILAAQAAYAAFGLMPELLAIYHLLGDPAMAIQ